MPIAQTRRLLKAFDLCASQPEQAARVILDRSFTERDEFALQTLNENPYGNWRGYDADTACASMRCRWRDRGNRIDLAEHHRREHRLALPR